VTVSDPARPDRADRRPPLVELRDLTVRYRSRGGSLGQRVTDVAAVDGVSLSVEQGNTLGIVGGTGSGKTTVAHVILGMVPMTAGTAVIAGHRIDAGPNAKRQAFPRDVQVVMQDPYSSLDPRMRVGKIIAEPLKVAEGASRRSRAEIRDRVAEVLRLVGLSPAKADLYPHQFSGGQRQRIALARALALEPKLIVLDEPTSALDVSVRAQILNLLRNVQEEVDLTYIVISHDLVTVAYLATEVAVMQLGRVVESGPTDQIFTTPRHPYTIELLASMPNASGRFLRGLGPTRQQPTVTPAGCRYAYRCALRDELGRPDRCEQEDPQLQSVDGSQRAACHFTDRISLLTSDAAAADANSGSHA
jgi:oligopeptide/dipeptide ABC transporter ATP-binding protein